MADNFFDKGCLEAKVEILEKGGYGPTTYYAEKQRNPEKYYGEIEYPAGEENYFCIYTPHRETKELVQKDIDLILKKLGLKKVD